MKPEDIKAVTDAVDPENKLSEGLRNALGMKAVYEYRLAHGDARGAANMAAAMLQHFSNLAAQYGTEAAALFKKGDVDGGVRKLDQAYNQIPDGKTAEAAKNPDGTYTITQKNADGTVAQTGKATPQDLMGLAFKLSDKSAYWGSLTDAASGRFGGTPQAPEPSQAYTEYQNKLQPAIPVPGGAPAYAGAPPAQSAPAGATPGQRDPGTTPGSTPTPAGANPAPAQPSGPTFDVGTPPTPAAADDAFVRANPPPPAPDLGRMATAGERQGATTAYHAATADWMKRRAAVQAEAKQKYSDFVKTAKPADYDTTDPSNIEQIKAAAGQVLSAAAPAFAGAPPDQKMQVVGDVQVGIVDALRHTPNLTPDAAASALTLAMQPNSGVKILPTNDPHGRQAIKFPDGRTMFVGKDGAAALGRVQAVAAQAARAKQQAAQAEAERQAHWQQLQQQAAGSPAVQHDPYYPVTSQPGQLLNRPQ